MLIGLVYQTKRLDKVQKYGYQQFLKYLDEYYFHESAMFNPNYYQYYDSILDGNTVTSRNCFE